MKESLLLFDEILNGPWFASTPFILFLNKVPHLSAPVPPPRSADDFDAEGYPCGQDQAERPHVLFPGLPGWKRLRARVGLHQERLPRAQPLQEAGSHFVMPLTSVVLCHVVRCLVFLAQAVLPAHSARRSTRTSPARSTRRICGSCSGPCARSSSRTRSSMYSRHKQTHTHRPPELRARFVGRLHRHCID